MNDPDSWTLERSAEPELGVQPDLRSRRGREHRTGARDGYWVAPFAHRASEKTEPNKTMKGYVLTRLCVPASGRVRRTDQHGPLVRRAGSWPSQRVATPRRWVWPAASSTKCRPGSIDRILPKPGTGPSERTRESGHYTVETYTTTTTGARYRATMLSRATPATRPPRCCWAKAVGAGTGSRQLTELHGVLTPAAAMGDALLARLPAADVSLEHRPAELIRRAEHLSSKIKATSVVLGMR